MPACAAGNGVAMIKEFLPYDVVRNDALKIAYKLYHDDGFIPDVIYCSLRGGASMANVISEYYKIVRKDHHPVLYAAVVARSYTDVRQASPRVYVDGWTYPPANLRPGDRIMLVDDIFDSGHTINALVDILLDYGVPRENVKVVVHDYKVFTYKEPLPIQPDSWCRKIVVSRPEEDRWIHYMSHELVGLSRTEFEKNYVCEDDVMRKVLEDIAGGSEHA